MSDYYPHNWVMIKIRDMGYKVFGGWRGGYLDGDSWRLNSGVTKAYMEDDLIVFEGYSGSRYYCHPVNYGIRGIDNLSVLERFAKHDAVTVMEEDTDWLNINYGEYDDNT